MIIPSNITNYSRSQNELEEYLLFCIAVAGKRAVITANQLETLLSLERRGNSPFAKIRNMVQDRILLKNLKKSKLGKYTLLSKSYKELAYANINLKTCEVKDLERFTGIGSKTSRYFILHTRPSAKVAALDTHILKWMSKTWPEQKVPKTTPSKKKYLLLEKLFLEHCRVTNITPAVLDLQIWNEYSRKITL